MYKILPISYSAPSSPSGPYNKIDFDYIAKAEIDDGFATDSEFAKRIKQNLYIRIISAKERGEPAEYLLDTNDAGFAGTGIFHDKYRKAAALSDVDNKLIFLNSASVKFIEEKWLNGYRFPQELYSFYTQYTNSTYMSVPPYPAVRLDKLIDHLITVTGKKRETAISKAAWNSFFEDSRNL